MRSARYRGWRLSIAAAVFGLLPASSAPGEAAPTPGLSLSPNCVPARSLRRSDERHYRRFHVLPRLHDRWRSADCYPRRVDDEGLAHASAPSGLMVAVNGRDAVIVDVDASWLDACVSGSPRTARLDRANGADLLELRNRIAGIPGFRDVDVLEIGLGRAFTSTGTRLQAILIGTLERSVRVQCYESLDPMIEQAARIFRDDRETVDRFYDFLTIERSSAALPSR